MFSGQTVEMNRLPAWDAVIVLVNDAFVQTRLSAGMSNYRSRFASLHLGGGINGL